MLHPSFLLRLTGVAGHAIISEKEGIAWLNSF